MGGQRSGVAGLALLAVVLVASIADAYEYRVVGWKRTQQGNLAPAQGIVATCGVSKTGATLDTCTLNSKGTCYCTVPTRQKIRVQFNSAAVEFFEGEFLDTGDREYAGPLLVPTTGDILPLYRARTSIEVTTLHCFVRGSGSPSVPVTWQRCDANGANCTNLEPQFTCGTTKTVQTGVVNTPSVAADEIVQVVIGTVAGTVTAMHLGFYYTIE